MTGMSVRVQRDGRWVSVEVERLTDAELDAWVRREREANPFDGWAWTRALVKWVRDHVREGDICPPKRPTA